MPASGPFPLPERSAAAAQAPISNEDLRIRFPEHDFDGYWFFGGLRGNSEFRAIMFGLSVGVNDGYDWGFRQVEPEPDNGLYAFQVIGPDRALGYAEQPIRRHCFEYDHQHLDVRMTNRARLSLVKERLSCHLQNPEGSLSLDISGRLGGIASWTPDMVLRGTSWVTVAMPDIEFEGELRAGDELFKLSGIGTLDHPMGRNRRSERSAGMGWWEYNCFMINDAYGLFQWKIVDRNGDSILSRAVTNFPDGQVHTGALDLDYLEWEDRGSIHVPRKWRAIIHTDHGVLEHEVHAVGPPWGGEPHRRGDPLPNFALSLNGAFTSLDGSITPTEGRGTGETVISERDPFSGQPQRPW